MRVGKHTGEVFKNLLIEGLGVQEEDIHAVGHSLGAHVVGHFGRTIESDTNQKILRTTGKNFNTVL